MSPIQQDRGQSVYSIGFIVGNVNIAKSPIFTIFKSLFKLLFYCTRKKLEVIFLKPYPLYYQPDDQQPYNHNRNGIIPPFRFSVRPHILRFLTAFLPDTSRNQFNRQCNQCRQKNDIIQISQYRNEIWY